MTTPLNVLVVGDVSIDRRAVHVDWSGARFAPSEPKWQQQQGLRSFDIPGGAWFVAACIERALSPAATVEYRVDNGNFDWATIENLELPEAKITLQGGTITFDHGHTVSLDQAIIYIGAWPAETPPDDAYVLRLEKIPRLESIGRPPELTKKLTRTLTKKKALKGVRPGRVSMQCRSLASEGHVLRNGRGVDGTITDAWFELLLGDIAPTTIGHRSERIDFDPRQFAVENSWVVAAEFRGASFGRAVFGGQTDVGQKIVVGPSSGGGPVVTTYKRSDDHRRLVHSWAELDLFPARPGDKAATIYRIRTLRGFAGPVSEPVSGINPPEHFPAELPDVPAESCVLVIEDQGNGHRDDADALTRLAGFIQKSGVIVYKATKSFPAADSRFWTMLTGCADRAIAVISADSLRDLGIDLARGLSWERAAEDLSQALTTPSNASLAPRSLPVLARLSRFRYLVVRFCLSGAALVESGAVRTLFFDPAEIEGTFRNPDSDGVLTGYNSVLVGGIIAALSTVTPRPAPGAPQMAEIGKALEVGIPAGLKSCRAYFDAGLGVSIADLAQLIRDVVPAGLGQPIGGQEFAVAPWEKITESQPSLFELACTTAGPPRVAELAQEIVRIGVKRALAGLASEHKFPFASFGDNFLVVDRTELEGYRAISTLIRNYAAHPAPARPLSLGVFGQPGAGKSFGVKQIALNLLGRDRVTFIDSNLSQFSSADDLADVFFSVRDVTLKAGQLPVVFFDEFDSQLPNAPLGWLKYFLAPMQDGKFKYKQTSLGIGKAIFVFAGGTRVRYDDLYKGPLKSAPRPVDKAGAVDGDESERFRRQKAQEYQQFLRTESRHRFSAKVHDFRRRLRGAVDIASINPEPPAAPAPPLTSKPESEPDPLLGEERSPFPDLYLIRRAILFRSMLGASAPHLLDDRGRARVDHGVVEAFLKVPHYEHGAGSMEAIIDMSSLRGSQYFTKAALPPSRLLEMHVQATEFLRCLRG